MENNWKMCHLKSEYFIYNFSFSCKEKFLKVFSAFISIFKYSQCTKETYEMKKKLKL